MLYSPASHHVQVYPRVKALDSSIEVTKTLLQPAAPPAGQGTVSGAHADDDKKTGGKGGKDKGGKVEYRARVT